MLKEFEFLNIINKTLSKNGHIGDDCAFLKEYGLCISTDTLVEDVHFSFKYMNVFEVAKKAMLVNISDILASGAIPKYAQIALSGKLNKKFTENFYKGIEEVAKEYDVEIIGGDLTGGDKISITITIFGDAKNRNISSRSHAKEGYVVAVAGVFGSSAKGFSELQKQPVSRRLAPRSARWPLPLHRDRVLQSAPPHREGAPRSRCTTRSHHRCSPARRQTPARSRRTGAASAACPSPRSRSWKTCRAP